MTRTIPSQDPIALDTPESKRRFSAEFATVAVDEGHLLELKAIVARLSSQQSHRPLNLDTLGRLFHLELLHEHIGERFHLSVERGQHLINEDEIAAKVNYYKDPMVISATLTEPGWFFLRHNFAPAFISSILILLAAGSLFYMGRIIQKQARLDEMKTDFINNISHELKTPLSILKTSNEALANFGAAEDPVSLTRYLGINTHVIEEMEENIDRLIDLPQNGKSSPTPTLEDTSLQELIAPIISRFSFGNSAVIEMTVDEEPFQVLTDRHMLGMIINNLVENAIKFSEGKANVTLFAQRNTREWQLSISDTGPGIAKAHLPYIFDKFYRVPTGDLHTVKGYGIGLSQVKEMVGLLKGIISVTSEHGVGSTFKIRFKH